MLRLSLSLIALIWMALPAQADIYRAATYRLTPLEAALEYNFTAQVPNVAVSTADPIWPEGCTTLSDGRQAMGPRIQYSYTLRCTAPFSADAVIKTPWAVDGITFITSVDGDLQQSALPGTRTGADVPIGGEAEMTRSFEDIVTYYVWQGIIHIWMGWDHLAFVLCLCLIASGRQLIWLVTAFTLGHSISLALAFFDVIAVPIPPMEAVIAFSIALMAREALLGKQAGRRATLVVSLFGLLHGLGFASALRNLGVQEGEQVAGLIFFNIGVEVGQLVFVGAMTLLLLALTRINFAAPAQRLAAYGAGTIGAFWTVERVAGFPWT